MGVGCNRITSIRRHRCGVGVVLVALLTLTAAACGTRVDKLDDRAGLEKVSEPSAPNTGGSSPTLASAEIPETPAATSSADPTSIGGSRPVAGPESAARSGGGGADKPGTGSETPASPTAGGRGGTAGAGRPVSGGPSDTGTGEPGPALPKKETKGGSPVLLASVGTYSGVVGATLVPILQGAQVWVKHVNEKGGVNGHKVEMRVYDDGGDTSRHRALVQQAIEQDHAIAFLANAEAVTGHGSVEYLNGKRVPVIGGDSAEGWAFTSPMYFPQAANDVALYRTYPPSAARMVREGKTKFGTVVCVEVPQCTAMERAFVDGDKRLGYDLVFKTKSSISQPDFTAECLAARNAGVQVLFVDLDANSISRVGASCARQGYRPVFFIASQAVLDRMKDDPNFDGALTATGVFPWFQTGTPATEEYQQAKRTYGGSALPGPGFALGWVSGKLMERATFRLPEPPTSAGILAGLWSLKGDTLGGLTMPLSFFESQPPKPQSCWFNLAIHGGSWVSADQNKLHCEDATMDRP